LKFQLSEKEKLLLDNHIPNTFISFVEGFINKMNNYLIEEFRYPPFQEAYLSELLVLKQKVNSYLYESDLAYSWINLEKYTYEDPEVSPEEAYTKIGYFVADFQVKVNALILEHFPEKQLKKEKPKKENSKKQTVNIERSTSVNTTKKSDAVHADKQTKSTESQKKPKKKVEETKNQQAPMQAVEKIKSMEKPKSTELPIPKRNTSSEPKPKVNKKTQTPLEIAEANYKREFKRYLSILNGHPVFINQINKRKALVIKKLQTDSKNNQLIQLIKKEVNIQPLPLREEKKYTSVKGYENETKILLDFTSYYARLAVKVVTNLLKLKEAELPTSANRFINEVNQLINDYLSRFSFYLIPSKKYKSVDYVKTKGTKTKNHRYLFGILLAEEQNGKEVVQIIEKGTVEFY
jgi:chemotaxis protein histidine kinase CheA